VAKCLSNNGMWYLINYRIIPNVQASREKFHKKKSGRTQRGFKFDKQSTYGFFDPAEFQNPNDITKTTSRTLEHENAYYAGTLGKSGQAREL
jgi:hypothetical protein